MLCSVSSHRCNIPRCASVTDEQGLVWRASRLPATASGRTHLGVAVYDALHLIYAAIKKTGGSTDGDALIPRQ